MVNIISSTDSVHFLSTVGTDHLHLSIQPMNSDKSYDATSNASLSSVKTISVRIPRSMIPIPSLGTIVQQVSKDIMSESTHAYTTLTGLTVRLGKSSATVLRRSGGVLAMCPIARLPMGRQDMEALIQCGRISRLALLIILRALSRTTSS